MCLCDDPSMIEAISVIGVDRVEVGRPRGDGTPGSGLYAVRIKLSRNLSVRERDLLIYFWDNPSSFSTMHRAGIARIVADTLILDGTTVEEVRDFHATTVKSAVAATNAVYAREIASESSRRDEDVAKALERDAVIRSVMDQITFD